MSKSKPRRLDFIIDKLSNSIEQTITGKVFDTRVIRLHPSDVKSLSTESWLFDWRKEIELDDREVYALTTLEEPKIIQGLISISDRFDHIFMNLLESSEFNVGKDKQFMRALRVISWLMLVIGRLSTAMMAMLHLILKPGSSFTMKNRWEQNELGQIECLSIRTKHVSSFENTENHLADMDPNLLDEYRVHFVNRRWTPEEEKELSEIINAEKLKRQHKEAAKKTRIKIPSISSGQRVAK